MSDRAASMPLRLLEYEATRGAIPYFERTQNTHSESFGVSESDYSVDP